jgi:hypothetical protein
VDGTSHVLFQKQGIIWKLRTWHKICIRLIFNILLRVRVSATVDNCGLLDRYLFIGIFTVTTAVVHFTKVQHINQGLDFWYHFTFDCSGPLPSGVFLVLISLLWTVLLGSPPSSSLTNRSCPFGLL